MDDSVLQVVLQPGESIVAEPSTFCYGSVNIKLESPGMGEAFSGLLHRLAGGHVPLRSRMRNTSSVAPGYVGLAQPHNGKVIALPLRERPVLCTRSAFLCARGGAHVELRPIPVEPHIALLLPAWSTTMLHVTGGGVEGAMLHICPGGQVMKKTLAANEDMNVDVCCLAALEGPLGVGVTIHSASLLAYVLSLGILGRAKLTFRVVGPGTVYMSTHSWRQGLRPLYTSSVAMAAGTGGRGAERPGIAPALIQVVLGMTVALAFTALLMRVILELENVDGRGQPPFEE